MATNYDRHMTVDAFEVIKPKEASQWVITCDHASNAVPSWVNGGHLGLSSEDMGRHIAYDIGAAGVTRHLASLLNATAVLSRFSRLVIDPNRGEDDPTLITQLYDGTIIEANRKLDATGRARRLKALYKPYHAAIDAAMSDQPTIFVAIHSFTRKLSGRAPRPWHVTVLASPADKRFSDPLLDELAAQNGLCTAENEPYTGALKGDSVDRHALRTGTPNALIEIRQDLIETETDQRHWADRLAPLLESAASRMQR